MPLQTDTQDRGYPAGYVKEARVPQQGSCSMLTQELYVSLLAILQQWDRFLYKSNQVRTRYRSF